MERADRLWNSDHTERWLGRSFALCAAIAMAAGVADHAAFFAQRDACLRAAQAGAVHGASARVAADRAASAAVAARAAGAGLPGLEVRAWVVDEGRPAVEVVVTAPYEAWIPLIPKPRRTGARAAVVIVDGLVLASPR
jgi:hypothetical protein